MAQNQELSPYEQALISIRQLSPNEQLAIVGDIVVGLRESITDADDLVEAAILAESPTFQRLVEDGLKQIQNGQARPVEALLDEL